MKSERTKNHHPPPISEWLVKQFTWHEDQESIIDNFLEEYEFRISTQGKFLARWWYRSHALRSVLPFMSFEAKWSIIMIRNYLKIAWRNIQRHKAYSFINISGLAVGMAVCTLIFLWVKDELNYDCFHQNTNRLYRVVMEVQGTWWTGAPWALAPTLKRDYPEVQLCTRFFTRTMVTKWGDVLSYQEAALVDDDFWEMFTYPFIKGDKKTAFAAVNSIVITEEMAHQLFGSEDPIGKLVVVNDNYELTVTGVMRNVPANSHMQFDFVAPVRLLDEQWINGWSVESVSYVLLESNIDLEDLRPKIAGTVMKYDTRTNKESTVDLQPITRIHLYNLNGTDPIINVYIFSVIAIFILVIACINYMNLATARSGGRAREICMRKVIGAFRKDIIKQFYGESFILTFLAMLLALLMVYTFLPAFNTLSSKQLTLNFSDDLLTFVGLLAIVLVTGFLAGSYPAMVLSSFKPLRILKGNSIFGSYKSNSRRFLVIGQFITTTVLILMTAMVLKQLNFILNKDLGIDKDNVVIIPLNQQLSQNYAALKEELLRHSAIVHTTVASSVPTQVGNMNPTYWEGKTEDDYINMNFVSVDYDYFDTFGMEIIDGRPFSREFSADQTNYVINEEAAKLMELDESPVGKMFSIWTAEGTVVGVVKNFHSRSLHSDLVPIVFTLGFQFAKNRVFIRIQSDQMQETLAFIEEKVAEVAPGFPFEYTFLDDTIAQQYTSDEQTGALFRYFSAIAIIISCLGIVGLASFMAEQRTKEIGIRKTMGATHLHIVFLLSKEFVVLVFLANLIAWPFAYIFINRWLQNYAFHTNISPVLFVFAGITTIAVALFSVSFQAFKAAAVRPVNSLKYE